MLCAIWYRLHNFKKCKKHPWSLQALKVTLLHWVFFTFFKLCKWYQITEHITFTLSNHGSILHMHKETTFQSNCSLNNALLQHLLTWGKYNKYSVTWKQIKSLKNQSHASFISNSFISNAWLKLAKNQANTKQHPEATSWGSTFTIWNLFTLFTHVIIQK